MELMEESSSPEIQEEANALIINVNENAEIQREANTSTQNEELHSEANASVENEDRDTQLVNDITKMLESSEPPLSPKHCIYRVPHDFRKLNEEAYTPQCISIGPFHHGDKRLETMEKLKVRYFKQFVKEATLNVKKLVSMIRDKEGDVRDCYAESIQLSSDDCVKLILMDASFIIMLFLIYEHEERRRGDDSLVLTPRMIVNIRKDMWLLENQLPFFVIKEIFDLAFASYSDYPSFAQLTFGFFSVYNTQEMSPDSNLEIIHFLDLLRTFFSPQSCTLPQRGNDIIGVKHLHSASKLHDAGVKFKVGVSKCLFNLKFENGVLEIPCLKLYNDTESLFRNLVAWEQCHNLVDAYVSDYISLLDFLIDIVKDVDLLVQKRILVHALGDSNAVTTLVNNLDTNVSHRYSNSIYCKLCKDLNTFYEDPRHIWKATLRRDYFSTPWITASTIAAITLLVLTLIQAVCSIISL
ncbi:UPF0481 protein At3g47200-like isoform X1 [Alnus glutinosa]|uniref:UPF0481 protein At3g47200-like isoform X1 n=1 Tax=Alnus glutinosa TaxID=3517 RepID=UPI002D79117F|nr:UPF0481 protein At3g47200-like isoform X1 [Alnus glutinosa]